MQSVLQYTVDIVFNFIALVIFHFAAKMIWPLCNFVTCLMVLWKLGSKCWLTDIFHFWQLEFNLVWPSVLRMSWLRHTSIHSSNILTKLDELWTISTGLTFEGTERTRESKMEETVITTVWHHPQVVRMSHKSPSMFYNSYIYNGLRFPASMTAVNAIKAAVSHPVVVQTTHHEVIIHFTPSSCCAIYQEGHQDRQTGKEREREFCMDNNAVENDYGAREDGTGQRRKNGSWQKKRRESATQLKGRTESGGWKGRRWVMKWIDRKKGRGGASVLTLDKRSRLIMGSGCYMLRPLICQGKASSLHSQHAVLPVSDEACAREG